MALRIPTRFAPSQIASIAMAETRLVGRAVPNVLRHVLPIVAWGVASIALGALLGLSAVSSRRWGPLELLRSPDWCCFG
jgi:hypothetical protein